MSQWQPPNPHCRVVVYIDALCAGSQARMLMVLRCCCWTLEVFLLPICLVALIVETRFIHRIRRMAGDAVNKFTADLS